MSAAHDDDPQRLRRLEQILSAPSAPTRAAAAGDGSDAGQRHLESVSLERIRQLTAELQARDGRAGDEIDALGARLLLNDYLSVLAHLRGIAREAGQRIDAAAESVGAVRRFLWRNGKLLDDARQALETQEDHEENRDA